MDYSSSLDHHPHHHHQVSTGNQNANHIRSSGTLPSEDADLADNIPQSSQIESAVGIYQTDIPYAASTSSRESIAQKAQKLIDDINAKRKQDTQLFKDFNKALEMQVQRNYTMIEQAMLKVYEKEGKLMEEKFKTLFSIIDRIVQAEKEMQGFKNSLQTLFQDMQHAE